MSNVSRMGQRETLTEATMKLQVGDHLEHTVSEGDGPVEMPSITPLQGPRVIPPAPRDALADYKVRVINARAGTAARVRVVMRVATMTRSGGPSASPRTSSRRAWRAGFDAFEYKLSKDARFRANEQTAATARRSAMTVDPAHSFRPPGEDQP